MRRRGMQGGVRVRNRREREMEGIRVLKERNEKEKWGE